MSPKWKIFLALNFVLSLPALVGFIFLLLRLINSYNRYGDYVFAFIFLLAFLLITLNGFLNIYILQRFFPNKLIPANVKGLNTTSLVLNILVSVGWLILCIYGATIEFSSSYERYDSDNIGKITLAILSFLWLVQVVVIVMQAQLPATIGRNNKEQINSLIDSIGQ